MRLLFLFSTAWGQVPYPHQEILLPTQRTSNAPSLPFYSSPNVTVYGYHAYWSGDPNNVDLTPLTHLAVFNVDLQADGSLTDTQRWTSVAEELVPRAHAQNVKVHLCMTSFDDAVINSVLPSAERRAIAIAELADLVHTYNADGVNVDIEGLDASQRENFVSFIEELKPQVGEVVIATPAVDWSNAFDYQTLADLSDGLFIMGYGYHWKGGDPGPVDPLYGGGIWGIHSLAWTVNDYQNAGAPNDKIILGLPLYGREWPTENSNVPGTASGNGVAVTMAEAVDRAQTEMPLYDSTTFTPYFLSENAQLWYGDVYSVQQRIQWVLAEEIQGFGFWALGYEAGVPGFWEMVINETQQPEEDDHEEDEDTNNDQQNDQAPTNTSPVALAGSDQIAYVNDTIVLNGENSFDPEGDSLSYTWEQIYGPPTDLLNDNAPQISFSPATAGTYIFQLTVSDGELLSEPDRITVAIKQKNGKNSSCQHFPVSHWLFPLGFFTLMRSRKHGRHSMPQL